MRTLISLGVAFFVVVLHLLIGGELTPNLSSETAGNILVMEFIGMAVITWLVLKYRQGRTAMIRRILISFGLGVANLAFMYVTLFVPNPRYFVKDAVTELAVSASFISLVTFVLLSLPMPLTGKWRTALISLSVAFFAAVLVSLAVLNIDVVHRTSMSIAAGVFISSAILTALVLRLRGSRS